jgi:hypothetical protein
VGMQMNMGLGGAGVYSGPVYGGDGPAVVPATRGYPDTAASAMTYGPGQAGPPARNPQGHALVFGLACFAALIIMGWALPR